MSWLTVIIAALKLLGSLASLAQESRLAGEGGMAALGRILTDAQQTVDKARKARAAAAARDADPAELRKSDGFRRD
jgi:hypothetical protein